MTHHSPPPALSHPLSLLWTMQRKLQCKLQCSRAAMSACDAAAHANAEPIRMSAPRKPAGSGLGSDSSLGAAGTARLGGHSSISRILFRVGDGPERLLGWETLRGDHPTCWEISRRAWSGQWYVYKMELSRLLGILITRPPVRDAVLVRDGLLIQVMQLIERTVALAMLRRICHMLALQAFVPEDRPWRPIHQHAILPRRTPQYCIDRGGEVSFSVALSPQVEPTICKSQTCPPRWLP